MNDLAPIALFVFNRPWHTRQTVKALQRNELAAESELIVFCDGPRNPDDRAAQDEIRDYITAIRGFKSIVIVERETNLGLAGSITTGVTEVLHEHGKIIVLEDDLVCSPHFLTFMNQALVLFEDEDRVAAVHGYVPPIRREPPTPFILRFVDCWGWGTWSRAWRFFEKDGGELMRQLRDRELVRLFNFNDNFDYSGMLEKQISGDIDSWAIRWYASVFLAEKFGVFPGRNLIRSISGGMREAPRRLGQLHGIPDDRRADRIRGHECSRGRYGSSAAGSLFPTLSNPVSFRGFDIGSRGSSVGTRTGQLGVKRRDDPAFEEDCARLVPPLVDVCVGEVSAANGECLGG